MSDADGISEAAAGTDEGAGVRTRQLYLTVAIMMLSLWMALPFLTPIAWAAILAIAEWPLYRRAIARIPPADTGKPAPGLPGRAT